MSKVQIQAKAICIQTPVDNWRGIDSQSHYICGWQFPLHMGFYWYIVFSVFPPPKIGLSIYKATKPRLPNYLPIARRRKDVFLKSIIAKWNTNSLIQELNMACWVHFLWWQLLCYLHEKPLEISIKFWKKKNFNDKNKQWSSVFKLTPFELFDTDPNWEKNKTKLIDKVQPRKKNHLWFEIKEVPRKLQLNWQRDSEKCLV